MGACYENYYHEFISCSVQPTDDNCIFLKRAIQALDTERVDPWVEVYAVHRGEVSWNGWGVMQAANPSKLKGDYGVEELPFLGDETGYLVRHVSQGRQATHDEIKKARFESLTNYHHLVRWLKIREK